jgi:hypothetical protein
MRATIIFLGLLAIIFSCKPNKPVSSLDMTSVDKAEIDTIRIENEELEYEILILEVGFEAWLATQRPMTYYTQSTLENKNKFYVSEWNRRANSPLQYGPLLYNQPIDYQYHIDYGLEVNYLLFMYFEFFQKKYKQRL